MAPRVALVHDWLTIWGGAEQVTLQLSQLFPDAPIFTSVYNPETMPAFKGKDIRTTYLQHLPFASTRHKVLIPLMPAAFESLDLRGFDVVISSSTGPAKGVITNPGQIHINYCHTPPRYLWNLGDDNRNKGKADSWLRDMASHSLRMWDVVSSSRPDIMLANSQTVADRISKIYRRSAEVVYPPVNTSRFTLSETNKGYYLIVSRLEAYKRVDLAIAACRTLGRQLVVVGAGPEESALRDAAQGDEYIRFAGRVSDTELAHLYAGARAFIFPAEEDFGIVPVEAMSAGKPVIGFGKGGLVESVVSGETGIFFYEQSVAAVVAALEAFEKVPFNPQVIRTRAEQFSITRFASAIEHIVAKALSERA